jgi:ribosomal protein S18 acetylase RimI-like enzyme
MKLRPIHFADRDRLLEIVTATGNFTPAEIGVAMEVIDDLLGGDEGYRATVAEDIAGTVVGYECHGPTPLTQGTWDLYWIAVDPQAQGGGYGRALLRSAEQDVIAHGGRLLLIETSSQESYAATIRFYERSGYPLVARLKNYYRLGDDKLIFGRELTPEASAPPAQ